MKPFNFTNLQLRLISALLYLPAVGLVFGLGGVWFVLAASFAVYIGTHELLTLLKKAGWQPLIPQGAIIAACLIAGLQFNEIDQLLYWIFAAFILALISLLTRQSLIAIGDWSVTSTGILYVSLPISSLVLMRLEPNGLHWSIFAILTTFATDTGAYIGGKLVGRHKLVPSVSPNKTWEGAGFGICSAIFCAFALNHFFDAIPNDLALSLILGLGIGVLSQAGDLLESTFKRLANVKDSGKIIPGHGGILDRLDSLIPIFPFVYLVFIYWPGA